MKILLRLYPELVLYSENYQKSFLQEIHQSQECSNPLPTRNKCQNEPMTLMQTIQTATHSLIQRRGRRLWLQSRRIAVVSINVFNQTWTVDVRLLFKIEEKIPIKWSVWAYLNERRSHRKYLLLNVGRVAQPTTFGESFPPEVEGFSLNLRPAVNQNWPQHREADFKQARVIWTAVVLYHRSTYGTPTAINLKIKTRVNLNKQCFKQ